MKYYLLFDKDNLKIHNPKAQDILNKFLLKKCITINLNIHELKKFFKNNKYNNIFLFYYPRVKRNNFFYKFLDLINSMEFNFNICIFTFDFWISDNPKYCHNIWAKKVFKAEKYKVITFCNNLEQLNYFHNFNYFPYKNNIIFNNIWCCYDKSFCKFNEKPKNKILISGAMNNNHYPERFILNNLISKCYFIEKYNYCSNDVINNNNNYNLTLNNYFACFSSSVYVQKNKEFTKYYNTHILLLKTFEILASGSLLILPKKEKEFIKKYGLEHDVNCYLLDFNADVISQINFIFSNIDKYYLVRKSGQKIAKEKFNSNNKIIEIKKLLNIL